MTPKNINLIESRKQEGDEYFDFDRRQTLKTGQRYSTPYLDQLQTELLGAKDKLAKQEFELLKELQRYSLVLALSMRRAAGVALSGS